MNHSLLLLVVERLEGFLGKLPASIQKPVLHELTPLKELFLQQRSPRFVLTGSSKLPAHEVVANLFAFTAPDALRDVLVEIFRWQPVDIGGHGHIDLLDARGGDERASGTIADELKRQPADVFLYLDDLDTAPATRTRELANLAHYLPPANQAGARMKIVAFEKRPTKAAAGSALGKAASTRELFASDAALAQHLVATVDWPRTAGAEVLNTAGVMPSLAAELPNQARVEMARISRDRAAQTQIAQMLVTSTTAICTAVGTQPIPLADLPILTTLQLAMVSAIMYVSGRERSLRAATEFIAALGANVGAGMLLREGTRAVLKFFPGWGNLVCGMVAGAGTYAIGKSAIVYFVEGLSLKDACRIYLASRKSSKKPALSRAKAIRAGNSPAASNNL